VSHRSSSATSDGIPEFSLDASVPRCPTRRIVSQKPADHGPSPALENVAIAAGHNMLGLSMAPATGMAMEMEILLGWAMGTLLNGTK